MHKSVKRAQKEQTIQSLTEKTKRAKSMVFTDYRGLTTAQMSDLRKKLRETNADFVITKNTLLKKALETTSDLTGPTATLFAYGDEIAPLKALLNFAKILKLPQIKLGIFNQELLDANQLDRLSKLPERNVLIGQLLQTINNPLFRLVNVLEGNIRNLVYVLKAIENNKQKN